MKTTFKSMCISFVADRRGHICSTTGQCQFFLNFVPMYSFEHFRKSTIWHAAQKASPPCIVAVGLMLSVFLFCICVESAGCFFALACSTRFFRLDNFYGSESKESNFHHLHLYLARVSSKIGWQFHKGGKGLICCKVQGDHTLSVWQFGQVESLV